MADQVMGIDGTLSTRTEGLRKRIDRNTDKQSN